MIEGVESVNDLLVKAVAILMGVITIMSGVVVFLFKRILFMVDREYNSKYDFLKFVNKITGKDHED